MRIIGWMTCILLGALFLGALVGRSPTPTSYASESSVPKQRDPRNGAVLKSFQWQIGGFGSIMLLKNAVIANTNKDNMAVQDIVIVCTLRAASGTVLSIVRGTIYDTVRPGSSKRISELNMGFMHPQAQRASCEVVRADWHLVSMPAPSKDTAKVHKKR